MTIRFPHIELSLTVRGRANLGGGGRDSLRTRENKANREEHASALQAQISSARTKADQVVRDRISQHLPPLPNATPLLLHVDPDQSIDYLRTAFAIEVVSEQGDGVIIAAATPTSLDDLEQKIGEFEDRVSGSGTVAKVHEIVTQDGSPGRLAELLPPELLEHWPPNPSGIYIVDASFSCLGLTHLGDHPEQGESQTDVSFERSSARWRLKQQQVHLEWDDLKSTREAALASFVAGYQGRILRIVDGDSSGFYETPDSFTCRLQLSGAALFDLVLNYPFLFEIELPPEIEQPEGLGVPPDGGEGAPAFAEPEFAAPAVCVIDSGVQEGHPLLSAAMDSENSYSYVPVDPDDVADHVGPGGHGTRVAGAVLFPEAPPTSGRHQHALWIQNARVLDETNALPNSLFPPTLLSQIVSRFKGGPRRTKIYNHSINRLGPCRLRHMSSWAAAVDRLSHEEDVLFIQSTGNIRGTSSSPGRPGVLEHLFSERPYPSYLDEPSSRIADPAQSMFAITVGSVAREPFAVADRKSIAGAHQPSAFTRTGMGLWGALKPEVVEFAGDFALVSEEPTSITTPPEVCPPLVRATHIEPGPRASRDEVGTSFAAPKVASVAAAIQAALPSAPSTLYRALLAQSARWPTWTSTPGTDLPSVLRRIGYGIPSRERSTQNSENRVTLVTAGSRRIVGKECHIYRVPFPNSWRAPSVGEEFLVEVCLAYTSVPRRTRQSIRGYLSTWLDWKAINMGESEQAFEARALRDSSAETERYNRPFNWTLGERSDSGMADGVRRKAGTLQKDWAVIAGHQLPSALCIAVVGHNGWDPDPTAQAHYSLVVSIESISQTVQVYQTISALVQADIAVRSAVRTRV